MKLEPNNKSLSFADFLEAALRDKADTKPFPYTLEVCRLSFKGIEQVEYEIGSCSVVDPVCLLFESLCVQSFDSNSEFKGGEFKSANRGISVFHL